MKQRIGILGVGNMGSAILEGLFKKNIAKPDQVWVYDKIQDKTTAFSKQWKVRQASSGLALAKEVDILLLAVKPQDFAPAGAEFKSSLTSSQVVISILAGTTMARLKQVLGDEVKIVRAMPNLGAKVGEAITAITSADPQALLLAEAIFSGCGKTIPLDEKHFDLVTAISGSGPAYFFHLMEVLEKIGIENGLSPEAARLLAVQTGLGAGKLAQAAIESPGELRVMVTSKGGTTEAALKVFESENFPVTVRKAIDAAISRSRELSQQ